MKRISLALMAIAAWTGCGGSAKTNPGGGTGAASCTVTLSGALTGSGGCSTVAGYGNGSGTYQLVFVVEPGFGANDPNLTLAVFLPGSSLQTGTFTSSGSTISSSTVTLSASGNTQNWLESYHSSGTPDQGSVSLTLTSTGTETPTGGMGEAWSLPHGSATMTLPPAPGGGTSGTVTASVSF